jgi:DNA-binding transcriptional LysR family regulator
MIDRFLLSFVELSRSPHLRQLAARLNVTPATLSLRIKNLEEGLGVQLFQNEGQRLVLTPTGKRLLPIAESILSGYSELQAVAKHMSRDPENTVRIGVIETVVHTFLPTLLATFASELPSIKVDLSLDLTRNLFDQLLAGELDLIVCVGDSPFSAQLVVDDVLVLPVHWVASSASGLAGADLKTVLKRRLFTQMPNTSPYRAVVAMLNGLATEHQSIAPVPHAIGSPSLAALVSMARQDVGVSIMPGIFAKEFLDSSELITLPMPQPRPFLLSQCHHVNPTYATLAAAKLVQKVCADFVCANKASGYAFSPATQ